MSGSFSPLVTIASVLFYAAVFFLVFGYLRRRRADIAAWERSPEGQRMREALDSWLLCKARLERAEPTGDPPVIRVAAATRRGSSGRLSRTTIREERRPTRLHVRLLPIGGGEVTTEAVVPILTEELGELTPGRIFSVLYDPRDPRRFFVDIVRRDETLIDAVTMRTRAAEENLRAAQAFSTGQG